MSINAVTPDMVLTHDAALASAAALLDMMHDKAIVLIGVVDYLDQWLKAGGVNAVSEQLSSMTVEELRHAMAVMGVASTMLSDLEAEARQWVEEEGAADG